MFVSFCKNRRSNLFQLQEVKDMVSFYPNFHTVTDTGLLESCSMTGTVIILGDPDKGKLSLGYN